LEIALAVCDGVLRISIPLLANHLGALASRRSTAVNLDNTRAIDRLTSQLRHSSCAVEGTRVRHVLPITPDFSGQC